MRLSMRNQLRGEVTDITRGEAVAVVTVALPGGGVVTATITNSACEDLGLQVGSAVTALVKSTDVALAVD